MATFNTTFLYLGRLDEADTDETDWDNEDTTALLGTYDHTQLEMVNVTQNDLDNDGVRNDDDNPGTADTIDYTIAGGDDAGSHNTQVDTTALFNIKVVHGDGTEEFMQGVVVQAANGDTFLLDWDGNMNGKVVQSVEIISEVSSNYVGISAGSGGISGTSVAICFGDGTDIDTETGPKPVETLQEGDLVRTLDNGLQPVRWITCCHFKTPGPEAPIIIEPGALGRGVPAKSLHLSPQHRVLAANAIVTRMFSEAEIFIKSKALTELPGVNQAPGSEPVRYWHIGFDRHEVIFGNGTPAESFFPGPVALASLSPMQKLRLLVCYGSRVFQWQHARQTPSMSKQRNLLARCAKNSKPVCPDVSSLTRREMFTLSAPA